MDPTDQEWLSIVRYTITPEERKIFIELPPSERKKFKEEFWKKRDPYPTTESNEFKEEYYARIEYANKYFVGGRPGYLQDRGRMYILFGPPTQRVRYPGRTPPYELWYYGGFPVYFVDTYSNGDYQLVATNVTVLHEIGSALASIRKGQEKQIAEYQEGKTLFDANLKIEKSPENEAVLSIEVPYKKIWFTAKEEILETTLELSVEVFDSNQESVWQFKEDYLVSLTEVELQKKIDKNHLIQIPLSLEEGEYSLYLVIVNRTGDEEIKKTLSFET
jgi:GWxTD domain-containing protein